MKQIYRGSLFLNGNVQYEKDLFALLEQYFRNPLHQCDELRIQNNILLVTTAWKRTEFDCDHVEEAILDMGITRHLDNLYAYRYFRDFEKQEPAAYGRYHNKQKKLQRFKLAYYAENSLHIDDFFERLGAFIDCYNNLDLNDIFNLSIAIQHGDPHKFINSSIQSKRENLDKIVKNRAEWKDVSWFGNSIRNMAATDRKLFKNLRLLEEEYLEKSGIRKLPLYRKQREELAERILNATAIVIFGGSVYTLNNRLRFFDLGPILMEALKRGTSLFGISAGTICMMKDFYMNDDLGRPQGFIAAEDFGLGFVKSLNLLPHADDYPYLMDKHRFRNHIAYLALRTFYKIPIGLETQSVLKCDIYRHQRHLERHFTSVGADPCFLYHSNGERVDLINGDKLVIRKGHAKVCKN